MATESVKRSIDCGHEEDWVSRIFCLQVTCVVHSSPLIISGTEHVSKLHIHQPNLMLCQHWRTIYVLRYNTLIMETASGCLLVGKQEYNQSFLKVPMKWKIEVLQNRLIWKAFKSEEEWCFPLCHISSRSRDIQDFCIMQIRYWWRHKVWQYGSQNTK